MEVVKYDLNTAAIAKMSDIYMQLKIDGIDDEAGAAEVHAAKMIVVKHRTTITKLRLGSNKSAQDFIKKNNKDAAVLIDALAPIEGHLKAEESKVDAEKERIKAKKKAAEKAKIEDRVTVLFTVGVNIPYFEAAMLSDAEYETMFDEATNNHMAERLRIQEEEKAKEEEAAKLKVEKANQEAEANRLAEIQAAQEAKEHELKEQQEAIERTKREEQERIDRAAFEKQVQEDARIQAEKDAEKERIEQIAKVEETRLRSLQAVGFVYQAKDLGTMQDKKFFALYDKHKKAWDKKQKEILAEEIKQKRIKQEKADAAEKARKAELSSDREKLMDLAMTIRQIISPPAIKNETAKEIVENVLGALAVIADNVVIQAEEL